MKYSLVIDDCYPEIWEDVLTALGSVQCEINYDGQLMNISIEHVEGELDEKNLVVRDVVSGDPRGNDFPLSIRKVRAVNV